MAEEKKVACIMLNSRGANGKPVIWHLSISEAILEIERGEASCSISIEELRRLQHGHLFGELETAEKVQRLEDRINLLQNDLSFLHKYKPIIERLTKITHTLKMLWDKSWWIICTLSAVLGIYWGLKQEGWFSKPTFLL
jgi:hypothetical protein